MALPIELKNDLLKTTVKITPCSLSGVWTLIPKYSDSLIKIRQFMKKRFLVFPTSFKTLDLIFLLNDRSFSLTAMSKGLKLGMDENLLYEEQYIKALEGKGSKITYFNEDKTKLITKTKTNKGSGERVIQLVNHGKYCLIDINWTKNNGKTMAISRLYILKESSDCNVNIEANMLIIGGNSTIQNNILNEMLSKSWDCKFIVLDNTFDKSINHSKIKYINSSINNINNYLAGIHTIFYFPKYHDTKKWFLDLNTLKYVINIIKQTNVSQFILILPLQIDSLLKIKQFILQSNSDNLKTCIIQLPDTSNKSLKHLLNNNNYSLGYDNNYSPIKNISTGICTTAENLASETSIISGKVLYIKENDKLQTISKSIPLSNIDSQENNSLYTIFVVLLIILIIILGIYLI